MIFGGLYLLNHSTKKKIDVLQQPPLQDLPFDTLKPKIYRNFFFHCKLYITTLLLTSEFQRGTFHAPALTGTLKIGCYLTCSPLHSIQKKWKLFYDMSPSFTTLRGSNGRVSCWIIAGSSPFCCSRRLLDKYLHQVPIIICNIRCLLLHSLSKTCVRSVLSTQIEITALWLKPQISDTAP